jgi:hypothetical protein
MNIFPKNRNLKFTIWVYETLGLVDANKRSDGSCSLHLQGRHAARYYKVVLLLVEEPCFLTLIVLLEPFFLFWWVLF